jgi:hypothetical protein
MFDPSLNIRIVTFGSVRVQMKVLRLSIANFVCASRENMGANLQDFEKSFSLE